MKKVLILACSYRVGGNSDTMAQWALEAAEQAGAQAELVALRDKNISPCTACDACAKTGRCIIKDDGEQVFQKLLEADCVIFCAPVNFYSFGAMPKALIDRAQFLWTGKSAIQAANKHDRSVYLLACGGQKFKDNFDCMEKILQCFSLSLEAKYQGGVFFRGIDAKGDINQQANRQQVMDAVRIWSKI